MSRFMSYLTNLLLLLIDIDMMYTALGNLDFMVHFFQQYNQLCKIN